MQHDIHEAKIKHAFANNSASFEIPSCVNETHNSMKDKIHIHSLQGYSGYIKAHILQSYQEYCIKVDCYVYTMLT